jgi:hypothetical protein
MYNGDLRDSVEVDRVNKIGSISLDKFELMTGS